MSKYKWTSDMEATQQAMHASALLNSDFDALEHELVVLNGFPLSRVQHAIQVVGRDFDLLLEFLLSKGDR